MSTIYEVAERAGVSASTVSRVFTGRNGVSAEKSRRVRQAALELSFTPNRTARSLRRRNSELIALLIPDIENPFFTALARGVEDVAQAAGYSVVLCNTDEDQAKEASYVDIAVSESMSGVIIAAAAEHSDLTPLIARGRPIIAVDRDAYMYEVDAVMVDNEQGSFAATEALFARGFRRVACITGPESIGNAQERTEGWRRAVEAQPSPMANVDAYVRSANYRIDGGREAMESLLALDAPPDAVFVANNMMAVGALQALTARGLTPPGFGVATFGDLPFSIFDPSAMIVVDLSARKLGETAAEMLLQRINGDDQPPRTVVLPCPLAGQEAP